MNKGYRFGDWRAARLAESLARACDEHGVPNSFAPSELAAYHAVQIQRANAGPMSLKSDRPARPMDYGKNWERIIYVMGKSGYEVGYDLNARRFLVDKAPGFAGDGGPAD